MVDPAAEDQAEPPRRDFGDLARLLNIAGAKPQVRTILLFSKVNANKKCNNIF